MIVCRHVATYYTYKSALSRRNDERVSYRIQGWNEQSDMTFGLWKVRIKSGLADNRELQLTIPQISVDRTFPRLDISSETKRVGKLTCPR
jgi:hypothetical protein